MKKKQVLNEKFTYSIISNKKELRCQQTWIMSQYYYIQTKRTSEFQKKTDDDDE